MPDFLPRVGSGGLQDLPLLPPRVRISAANDQTGLKLILDPPRLLRWVYVGRFSVATAIFIAAAVAWSADRQSEGLPIVAIAFAATTFWTLGSFWFSEIYRRAVSPTFAYLQSVFDLLLVTVVVHLTGGGASQFAALYILVIAVASLLLPAGGGLLVAALGNVLYFGDAVWLAPDPSIAVWLQLGVFACVALGSAFLAAKLQEAGLGKEELAAELTRAKLQASDILHNIRSGVVTIDEHGTLLYANPTAAQLLGLPLETLLEKPVLEPLAAVAPTIADALYRSVRDRVRTNRGEGWITTGGRHLQVGVTTTYVEGDARKVPRTATAIFQDISDQKRLETLRLRAERLEGIAELSASLAHEIKNPLAGIRSAVEQLSRMAQAGDDERVLTSLVIRESDRLSRLLSEFLDFARVRVTRLEPVDLVQVAADAVALVSAHPDRAEGVSVACIVPEGAVIVSGDDDLLHRATFNLLLNAVQATPPGGAVSIEVLTEAQEPLPPVPGAEDGVVALRVSDTGAGVDPEARDRLFDPFFTTKPGGSGLGLAVVQRAVEAHRGFVLLDSSTEGGGTRFTVVLPRAADALAIGPQAGPLPVTSGASL